MTLGELALVGVSRAGTPAATDTPVDAIIDAAAVPDPAQRVLLTAAALDVYRRAGMLPNRIETLPEPALDDQRPACSMAVRKILGEMLGAHRELLREAFQLIDRAGQRLGPAQLIACLNLQEPELRAAVRPLLDERGRWLARQREEWSWAEDAALTAATSVETLKRTFEEGTIVDRVNALSRMRASDPAIARQWIAATWKSESLDDRIRLLAAFEIALGPDDASWLEDTALKDRGAGVRARVALLLARLPESAFAARAIARAEPLLTWEPPPAPASAPPSAERSLWNRVKAMATGADRTNADAAAAAATGTLHVSPPTAPDPAWEADGVSLKGPKGQGERAYWLSELLALVPPSHWIRRFNAAPADLVRAAWQTEWGTAVAAGWSRAAVQAVVAGDTAEWITALWDGWLTAKIDKDHLLEAAQRKDLMAMLFEHMPAADAESRLIANMHDPQSDVVQFAPTMALRRLVPWPPQLSTAVLDALSRVPRGEGVPRGHRGVGMAIGYLTIGAYALPPSHFERGIALATELGADALHATAEWRRALDLFFMRIRLRQRLYEELAR